MVAQVILFTAIVMVVFLLLYVKTLPYLDKWWTEHREASERERERTERLVTAAEEEYDDLK